MNLHQIVSGAIGSVNPNIPVLWFRSIGFSTDASGNQVPSYAAPLRVVSQVQELTTDELQKVDGLNIQGNKTSIYLNGRERAIVREKERGGDLFIFRGQTWLAVAVLESWPDWTKLALVLQNDQ